MNATNYYLKTRVSEEMKERVRERAQQQLIAESIWLRRAVIAALDAPDNASRHGNARNVPAVRGRADSCGNDSGEDASAQRVCIRLRVNDLMLLRERALARGMPSATYVAVLLRAHLRHLAPLPQQELAAMKRSVAELAAIGRNLNQIARAANRGDLMTGPHKEDLHAFLATCEALRDEVKKLIRSNVQAWEVGHAACQD
jgi:hypothetical protein